MLTTVFSFLYRYFFEAVIVFLVGLLSKALVHQFGRDRADLLRETVMEAMLWAEETLGLGSGNEKFKLAWKKIIELLAVQGIKMNKKEESLAKNLMKANVPEINSLVYSSLPPEAMEVRKPHYGNPETKEMVEALRRRYGGDGQ